VVEAEVRGGEIQNRKAVRSFFFLVIVLKGHDKPQHHHQLLTLLSSTWLETSLFKPFNLLEKVPHRGSELPQTLHVVPMFHLLYLEPFCISMSFTT